MNTLIRLTACCLFSTLLACVALAEENWPRFRGPNGDGVVRTASIPVEWSPANYLWRIELEGNGHGSPSVWGSRLFLMVGDPGSAAVSLACFDVATGAKQWQVTHAGTTHRLHALNNYASTTPAIDAAGVYTSWADGKSCYVAGHSLDGKELWKKSLGGYESNHGYSRSPIVEEGVVYLAFDERKHSFVMALDARTGNEIWKVERPSGQAAYDTPCIITTPEGGKAIVNCSHSAGMEALDAKTGKLLWNVPDAFPQRCVSSPVYAGGMLFGTSGSGGGGKLLVAVNAPNTESSEPVEAYRLTKAVPYVPTPLVIDDLLVLWHERGTVAGFDLKSGTPLWLERVGGKYFTSPVCAGEVVYNVSMEGQVVALSVNREGCKVLAQNDLGEPSQATPAVVGNRMYLRTDRSLMCIGAVATAKNASAARQ